MKNYFILTLFEDKNRFGKTDTKKYRTLDGAIKRAKSLIDNNDLIMIRHENDESFFSSSSPVLQITKTSSAIICNNILNEF